MVHRTLMKPLVTAAAGAAVLALMLTNSPLGKAKADDGEDDNETKVQIGFAIAPVHLNLAGRNRSLVGLGSYIVNGPGDCNGCHTRAASPFAPGGDPAQGQPKVIDAADYLAGGFPRFGPVFIPRNLTPDKTGKPEGGSTYQEFHSIIRTGVDPDKAHPQFGPFLQVMPWPAFQNMTEGDLRAIYEYLSAIPCVEGDPGLPAAKQRPLGTRCK